MAQERISPLEESIRDPLPRLKEQLIEEFEGQREDLIDQAASTRSRDTRVRRCESSSRSSPGDTLEGTSAAPPDPHRVSCFANAPYAGETVVALRSLDIFERASATIGPLRGTPCELVMSRSGTLTSTPSRVSTMYVCASSSK